MLGRAPLLRCLDPPRAAIFRNKYLAGRERCMHAIARFMGRRRDSPARISFNLTIASAHFSTAHNVEAFHDDIKSYPIRSLAG
jgi:hypothetical protein